MSINMMALIAFLLGAAYLFAVVYCIGRSECVEEPKKAKRNKAKRNKYK